MIQYNKEYFNNNCYFFMKDKGDTISLYYSVADTITESRKKDEKKDFKKKDEPKIKKIVHKFLNKKTKPSKKEIEGELNDLENKKEISGTLKIDKIPFMEMIDFIPFPFIVLSFDGILIYFNEIFINEFKGEISYGKNWLLKETEIANKLKNLKSNHNSFLINKHIFLLLVMIIHVLIITL